MANPNLTDKARQDFQIAMLLGLAYSASIGGLATLIGTPPNALLMGFMAESYGIEITEEMAKKAREHNDANILSLGADYLDLEKAKK